MASREPPLNKSPQAVALRKAALAFAKNADKPVNDYADRRGQAFNRALLKAAVKYAYAVALQAAAVAMVSKIPLALALRPGGRRRG